MSYDPQASVPCGLQASQAASPRKGLGGREENVGKFYPQLSPVELTRWMYSLDKGSCLSVCLSGPLHPRVPSGLEVILLPCHVPSISCTFVNCPSV